MSCESCLNAKAVIVRPKNHMKVCKECFFQLFENEVMQLIENTKMFNKGARVGIGISGGKDSTVLAYVLSKLNIEHDLGLNLLLLCVDEGISGYRDRSIETVLQNQKELGLQLEIVSYKDLFGMTMDDVVAKIGKKGNCTYCGVFRRQALEEAARKVQADYIVTGHNADDMAETVLLNFIRGDISRLKRCTLSSTQEHADPNSLEDKYLSVSRCKPFKYSYQKEIVLYAYFKKLNYFSNECTYAPSASRGDTRTLIKNLERIESKTILNIIKGAEAFSTSDTNHVDVKKCLTCKHPTSSKDQVCNACGMVFKLSKINIGK